MAIEYDDKVVEQEAWSYLGHALTTVWEHDYDDDFKELKWSLGFDYSPRLGHLVYERAQALWAELKARFEPAEAS